MIDYYVHKAGWISGQYYVPGDKLKLLPAQAQAYLNNEQIGLTPFVASPSPSPAKPKKL